MLPEQKYKNEIRIVSGTVNVEPEDSVLRVTTTSVAATINLQTIPTDHWSTQYKLYIVDDSGNAGTNNITIVAPAGFTINGSSTAIINQNNGSAIVRVVSNTAYQAQLSSFSSTNTPMPYMYSQKLLNNPATNYIPVVASGVNSVMTSQQITAYDSTVNSNLAGFNATTGVFTVPSSGYYSVNAKLITRLLSTSVDSLVDGSSAGWMSGSAYPDGLGMVSVAVIVGVPGGSVGTPRMICADKQVAQNFNVADINIGCSQNVYFLTAGEQISVYALNKTNHGIFGFASRAGQPDCLIDFSLTKIG